MYPEDRVLVGIMPHPRDLMIAQEEHWYRIPQDAFPHGIHAEYLAFYFPKRYPPGLRHAVHYYARHMGHELVRRVDLFPQEADHKRAERMYYRVQLGPLKPKEPPIASTDWKRITFIRTTWDRFIVAREIGDLFSKDQRFVDRVYHALRLRGLNPERDAEILEGQRQYTVDLLIPCRDGAVMFSRQEERPKAAGLLTGDEIHDVDSISRAVTRQGGPLMIDLPT